MGLLDYTPNTSRIKICGLRTPADIEAVVKANVDAIGLVFYPPSSRAIKPEDAGALIGQLPKGIDAVGLVVNPTPNQIEEIRANAAITMWQFHENAHRVVLSGGLNAHNVGEAIARLHPCALDISSGVEISKGVKDPALIQQFVDAVRVADRNSHS